MHIFVWSVYRRSEAKKITLGESPKGFQVLKVESGVNESAA